MSYKKMHQNTSFAANNITANFDVDWDVDRYRDEHESEDHWLLRKAFMEKWKNDYPEERLVCLARVFTNVEFMGCRYPTPVMQEIARLSFEVGRQYREQKKMKLQRTFVSASDAAEDRAKGIKRVAGEIIENNSKCLKTIAFVPQSIVEFNDNQNEQNGKNEVSVEEDHNKVEESEDKTEVQMNTIIEYKTTDLVDADAYIRDMLEVQCLDVREFNESMFKSPFGRMVLLVRPWARKLCNIQTSCQVCGVSLTNGYVDQCYSLCINGELLAQATGSSKVEARNAVEDIAWERLRREVVSVVIKELFVPQGDTRISVSDVSGKSKQNEMFGTRVENSVATKMMKMMGWQGGGLGAGAQGIAEPIKPNLQMVNRAGLGSCNGVKMVRRAAHSLMSRYIASDTIDVDLVFSSDFTKDERAILHHCAQKIGLASRSYGEGDDRFLVVRKKLNPFALASAIIEKGGVTSKYQVFIPATLKQNM